MPNYYIGLMSGTSMDAIDAVLVDLNQGCALLQVYSHPFPAEVKSHILACLSTQNIDLPILADIDSALGESYAEAVVSLLEAAAQSPDTIKAIGSHGQTLFHQPHGRYPTSIQIGNPNVIAERTQINTIADFRRADMAVGGQGAPLVPSFHASAFRSDTGMRVIVNLGGIANFTLLDADSSRPITGYDIGPGNTLMDAWIQQHHDQAFDTGGQWASKGRVIPELLEFFLTDPYFHQSAPKSTGREHFNLNWIYKNLSRLPSSLNAADVQRTLLALTVTNIEQCLVKLALPEQTELYICGGGARNDYLMSQLKLTLSPLKVDTTNALGIDPQWVEACAFAYLAKCRLDATAGNSITVTGAKKGKILGGVYSY